MPGSGAGRPGGARRGQPFGRGGAAHIAFAEGRIQDAIRDYRRWYDEDGCAVCGLFLLGRAYERAGQPDSAVAAYERAVNTPGYRSEEHTSELQSQSNLVCRLLLAK